MDKIVYQLGSRDMIANLFMEIRLNGVEKTLKKYAESLQDNPHCKFYLNNN